MVPFVGSILVHVLMAPAREGEVMRGYLHGSAMMNLIGEQGGRIWWCAWGDLVVVGLQSLMIGIDNVRAAVEETRDGKIKHGEEECEVSVSEEASEPRHCDQDLDAEERGMQRYAAMDYELRYGIELNDVSARNSQTSDAPDGRRVEDEHATVAASDRGRLLDGHNRMEDNTSDILHPINTIIAEIHILTVLRTKWREQSQGASSALQSLGFTAGYAATTSNREVTHRILRHLRSRQ